MLSSKLNSGLDLFKSNMISVAVSYAILPVVFDERSTLKMSF